jgi:hypothetical protein
VGGEGDVVDGDRKRNAGQNRCGVGGREEYVRAVAGDGATQVNLFPPGTAAAAVHDPDLRRLGIQRQRERFRRIDREPARAPVVAPDPATEQFSQVTSNSRRRAEQLARVDANPQRRHA